MKILTTTQFDSPLGLITAIADEESLYLLEFSEKLNLDHEIKQLNLKTKTTITTGTTAPLKSIQHELQQYFKGHLQQFKTPLITIGSPFQTTTWNALKKIPYGKTCSYGELAKSLGQPTAFRAVARANSMNHIAIVIPCHRVINSNGELGGYAGGVERKQWLLDHEKSSFSKPGYMP